MLSSSPFGAAEDATAMGRQQQAVSHVDGPSCCSDRMPTTTFNGGGCGTSAPWNTGTSGSSASACCSAKPLEPSNHPAAQLMMNLYPHPPNRYHSHSDGSLQQCGPSQLSSSSVSLVESALSSEEVSEEALLKWKRDQPRVCVVCMDDSVSLQNQLLVCSSPNCDVCVHQECYGVSAMDLQRYQQHQQPVPVAQQIWFCDHCQSDNIDKNQQMGGALKQLRTGNAWVHVACSIWIPEVEIRDPQRMSEIDVRKVPHDRYNKYCYLCTDEADAAHGACLQCSTPGCTKCFHVSCAMKWGLLEDLSAQQELDGVAELSVSFALNCHMHKPIPIQPSLHLLEKWRLRRPTVGSGNHWHVPLNPGSQAPFPGKTKFELFLEASIAQSLLADRQVVTLKEKFENQYSVYDQERNESTKDLVEENQELLEQRPDLEQSVLEMKERVHTLAGSVHGTQNVVDTYRQHIKEIRGALLTIFHTAMENGYDWRSLTEEGAVDGANVSTRAAKGKFRGIDCDALPEHVSPEDIIAFFVKFNGDGGINQLMPLDPEFSGFTQMEMLNLSQVLNCKDGKTCTNVSSDMDQNATNSADIAAVQIKPCSHCRVRLLPPTAPVLPQYRNTLLSCATCNLNFHLCCQEPPLREPPAEPWNCTFCTKGAEILLSAKMQPMRSSKESLSASHMMDMDFDDGFERPKPAATSPPTATSVSTLAAPAPRRRNVSMASASAAAGLKKARQARAELPPTQPTVHTHLSLVEAKKVLHDLLGNAPPFPQELLRRQNLTDPTEAALRAFVFNDIGPEERYGMERFSMWRIMHNVPPKADPADVLAMIEEGKKAGFGKCADAFEDYSRVAQFSLEKYTTDGATAAALNPSSGSLEDAMDVDASAAEEAAEDDDLNDETYEEEVLPVSSRRRHSGFTAPRAIPPTSKPSSGSSGSGGAMKPERQPSRWDGDLYKPFWTRGYGKAKEGWCGLCEPGQWLKTKTSVYWYHMHNFHGVSSIAGDYFAPPSSIRTSEVTALREAFCEQCKKWIPVQSEKPVNVEEIYWFKHAQKCHRYSGGEDAGADD